MMIVNIARAFFIVLLFSGHPVESASWSPPIPLGTGKTETSRLAVDSHGNAVAIWTDSSGNYSSIQASKMPLGGTWSEPIAISPPNIDSYNPVLAMDNNGNVVALWLMTVGYNDIIQTAVSTNDGTNTWHRSPKPLVFTSQLLTSISPQVVFDNEGNALAAWITSTNNYTANTLQSARLPSGSLTWINNVEFAFDEGFIDDLTLTFDPFGNAVAVWSWYMTVQTSTLSSNSDTWSSATDLNSDDSGMQPQIAIDPEGNVVVIWFNPYKFFGITAVKRVVGHNKWVNTKFPIFDNLGASLALDRSGNAFLLVRTVKSYGENIIQFFSLPSSGKSWSEPTTLSAANQVSVWPILNVDPSGNILAVWTNSSIEQIQGATLPVSQQWSPIFEIADMDNLISRPQVGLSSMGTAVIAYPVSSKKTQTRSGSDLF